MLLKSKQKNLEIWWAKLVIGQTPPDNPSNTPNQNSSSTPVALKSKNKTVAKQVSGKMQEFFRSFLIWLGVMAISFLAGVGTYNFAYYIPLDKSLSEAQVKLEGANTEFTTLTRPALR